MVKGFRNGLVLVCILGAAVCCGAVASASAAGAWSAPQQVDSAGATVEHSYLIACSSESSCVGASESTGGPVAYRASASGTRSAFAFGLTVPFGSGYNDVTLTSLQCPSASLCVATANYDSDDEDDFATLTSTDPAAGPDSWIPVDLELGNGGAKNVPDSLSCPTTSFCAGPDAGVGVVVSPDPTGGPSAWKTTTFANGLVDLNCPSADFCAGYDANGDVWTSTDPTGGPTAWIESGASAPLKTAGTGIPAGDDGPSGVASITSTVSCSGPSLCIAAGASGSVLVSTDPSGSAAWTSVNVSSNPITAVYCEPGTTLCLAGDADGEIATSDDAAVTWTLVATPQSGSWINGLSCDGQTCSASLAAGGEPLLATVPAGEGPLDWADFKTVNHDALSSISCPSAKQCLGSDGTRYYTSTNPAQGVHSWHHKTEVKVPVYNPTTTIDISCYAATGCLAGTEDAAGGLADVEGGTLDRFDPLGGAHAFHGLHVGGDNGIDFVTCAQGTCVAGYPGNWYQTGHPAENSGWHTIAKPRFDVTCLKGDRSCVALADGPFPGAAGHDLLVAPRRTGPWQAQDIDPAGYISGLACTSAKACVIVDEGGNMLVSTAPTAGTASWHLSDTDLNGFNDVACETARTCVAVDDSGGVVIGRP